jgi:hypothetical protein
MLPTKDNLVRRHIITHDSHFCVTCCGGVETVQHLFISSSVFALLLSLIRTWVGITSPGPFFIQDHFVQLTHSAGGPKLGVHSCSNFGNVAFSWCGMNEIVEFLR